MTATILNRTRRRSELALGLLVVVVTGGGYILVALSDGPELPADLWVFLASVLGLYVVAHFAVRRLAPGADATLLPLAAALNGIGFVTISRLDRELARIQAGWVAVGVAAFVVTLLVVRSTRLLEKYRYTFALLGVGFLLLPLLPGIGRTINGARLWVSIGPLNFQPGEIAKVLLVIFFAAYLADNRELLAAGSVRVGRFFVPALRHLGPLALAWGFSILVMVYEKDLGSSLLFFGVFAAMLYMATGRAYYLFVGLILFFIGAAIAYAAFGHVQVRVDTWLDPWRDAADTGFQIIQSWYAFGTGGFAGTGLGLGNPDKIPNAATDFVFSAIGEELGLIGTIGVLIGFMLFVGSAYRVAVDATRPFAKLFAAGIATIIGFQTVIILGGVMRVIPLTGITLPFVSYGGSSLVANFVALALLLRVSDETARAPRERCRPPGTDDGVNLTIRRVGIGMLILFLGLVGQATYLQVVRADDLKNDPNNIRVFLRDYSRPRGLILTVDRTILAQSVPTEGDLEQIRVYPPETAQLFSHVVGYQAVNLGNTGVEAEYNDQLVGRDFDVAIDDISDFFSGKDKRGNVVLTMEEAAQRSAADALAGRRGSIVVLDVTTGAIVAAYSNPTFDPNPLASHDTQAAGAYFTALNADPTKPALARAWREIFPPGSTFKVVTTGIGLQSELVPNSPAPPGPPYRLTVDNPVYPELRELDLPQTDVTLPNFGDDECGGTLAESFRVSCNTTFGQIGLDLGDTFASGIERFGVGTPAPDTDLRPNVVRSIGPETGTFQQNQPLFAQSAIGQGTIAVTPLEMAMVAQGVANGGVMMVPHVLDHVENSDSEVISGTSYKPREYSKAMEPATAATVRDLMIDVVNNGTGTRAQIPGVQVAGKTGTADVAGESAHAWFIGFAPANAPKYAIAVLVENGGDLSSGDNGTGGRVAAPLAAQVLGGLLAP